jgi:hypothetical protein
MLKPRFYEEILFHRLIRAFPSNIKPFKCGVAFPLFIKTWVLKYIQRKYFARKTDTSDSYLSDMIEQKTSVEGKGGHQIRLSLGGRGGSDVKESLYRKGNPVSLLSA